jgi:hypothetical protein
MSKNLEIEGKKKLQPVPKPVISKPTRPWKGQRKKQHVPNPF